MQQDQELNITLLPLSSKSAWMTCEWELVSKEKTRECGDPVYIPTVDVHDMCMTCMCGCSAHVYDHRTTCGVHFLLPPLWRFSEIKLRSSGLYATTFTYRAILPAPNLVWWHPLEQTAWLVPSFSTKYELWTLAILEQCKVWQKGYTETEPNKNVH